MSHRAKQRSIVGLLAVAGVAAAVALVLFGMPYARTTPEAFAHLYTHPGTQSIEHVHIDADITNGRPCDPQDDVATAAVGAPHTVGICFEDYTPNSVAGFEMHVIYDCDLNLADEEDCLDDITGKCLDDNPDANDGDDPTGYKLGNLWDCSAAGVKEPWGDDPDTPGVCDAFIVCVPKTGAEDQDLAANPGLLATIDFVPQTPGVDNITIGTDSDVGANRSCGDIPGEAIGCFGATINKVPDIGIEKSLVGQVLAGGTATFAIDVTSNVPGTTTAFCDDLPNNVTFNAGLSDPSCALVPDLMGLCPIIDDTNVVVCMPVVTPATVNIVVDVPLEKAGKSEVNAAASAGDPNPANDVSVLPFSVEPADISITKSADRDPAVYSEGEEILWDIVATVNGPSPASDVVLSDTVGANQEITYCFALVTPPIDMVWPCACTIAVDLKSCDCDCTGLPIDPGGVIGMAVDADVVGSADNLCVDDAEVCWADPLCDSVHEEAVCLPPTTRMEKDLDEDAVAIVGVSNLFLEMGPDGLECLTIYELVSNAGNDPDGVGAYEFQLKFDHKIFDIEIEDSSWLSNEGARTVDCSMTILSENDIRFGCVSSGPTPGQMDDGVAAIITVCPEPDLVNRLTPGQDNGVVRTLLDENCELADVLGDPLQLEDGTLAPGVLPGGILAVCSDMTITVRILEADLDLDCHVSIFDAQAIAFRYGAVFGNLLYDPWYDLQPALKDYDIDIKDLQKVFGRLSSTCANPVPPQDPLPAPPW